MDQPIYIILNPDGPQNTVDDAMFFCRHHNHNPKENKKIILPGVLEFFLMLQKLASNHFSDLPMNDLVQKEEFKEAFFERINNTKEPTSLCVCLRMVRAGEPMFVRPFFLSSVMFYGEWG